MKIIVLFIALFGICTTSFSQSEKEIVARYRAAVQKSADSSAVKTIDARGLFILAKMSFPLRMYMNGVSDVRIEMEIQGQKFISLSNDSLKWEYNPLDNTNKVTAVNDGVTSKEDSDDNFNFVNNDLLFYVERKHKLKLAKKTRVDSLDVYVLELTLKGRRKPKKFYIDRTTSLIYKVENGGNTQYFADYRTTFDGFIYPTFFASFKKGEELTLRFSEFVFNTPLPDSLFTIPDYALDNGKGYDNEFVKEGDSLANADNYAMATESYTKAIERDSKNYTAYNRRGSARLKNGEYYEAISDLTRGIELSPTPLAYNDRGLAKYYLGDYRNAIKDYASALELDSVYIVSIRNRGLAYVQSKDYETALQDYQKSIRMDSTDGDTFFKVGFVYAQLGNYKDAIRYYRKAARFGYATDEFLNYKGVTEYQLGSYDSAFANFQRASKMKPDNVQYLENIGMSLYRVKKYEEASTYFAKYIQLKSDNAETYNMMGLCKFNEENYKGAIKDFSKAIEVNGNQANYYRNRGHAKELQQDFVGAIADYGESIRVSPSNAEVFYKRGLLKIRTSAKIEGCLDLATANEMKYEPAKQAILENCN